MERQAKPAHVKFNSFEDKIPGCCSVTLSCYGSGSGNNCVENSHSFILGNSK